MKLLCIFGMVVTFAVATVGSGANEIAREEVTRTNEASSRDHVRQFLSEHGIDIGHDSGRERTVAVGSGAFALKDDAANDEDWDELKETYDFPDSPNDDFQTKRFKAMWKAYADGLASIARDMGQPLLNDDTNTLKSSVPYSLGGVATITSAESLGASDEKFFEVSIAVCQSKKREEAYSKSVRPGKCSISEWIEQKSELGMICPQSYCDNDGVWWRVAGVPVSLEAGRNSKKVAIATEMAKHYAYEAALRTIAVKVSASTSIQTFGVSREKVEKNIKRIENTVKIDPQLTVLPVTQTRWFELERKYPISGENVRCIVAALRSGSSRKADIADAGNPHGTAMEQAKGYLEQKGWRTGREFLKASSFAVAIGGAAFKYVPSMDGATFAQKRNDAVRQALMESAMNVAFTYDCRGDLKMILSADNNKMQQAYVGDEAVERIAQDGMSFCDDSDTEVDLKRQGFMWWARFSSLSAEGSETKRKSVKKVLGRLSSEMPIHGLKVERQFESIVDGVYQIAFVVTCDPKRGKDMVLSFANEKSRDGWGKLPLGQWIAEQDFGMMAGPRKYVDDKGNVWMIGIAPAAEGCRPFGSSLDGMAREYAAFGLSGDVKASYEMSSFKSSSGEYLERKAEILYNAESSPTGKYYPKEFELVFHHAFTHPLTGRKGEVSICALRSGTKELVDKLTAEQVKENLTKAKEQERKKGIRDSLLEKGTGQSR